LLFVGHGGIHGRSVCGGDGSGEYMHGVRHVEAVTMSHAVGQKKGVE
jgi:hypothetical protein